MYSAYEVNVNDESHPTRGISDSIWTRSRYLWCVAHAKIVHIHRIHFYLGVRNNILARKKEAYHTGCSQAVPHPSTIPARRCLTSVIRRERVCSSWYGRRQLVHGSIEIYSKSGIPDNRGDAEEGVYIASMKSCRRNAEIVRVSHTK